MADRKAVIPPTTTGQLSEGIQVQPSSLKELHNNELGTSYF